MSTPEDVTAAFDQLLRQQSARQHSTSPLGEAPTSIDASEALSYADKLRGKVIVVTGAAGGFGKEYSLTAARSGAKLVLSDLRLDAVQAVADEIKAAGGEAIAIACNVSSWKDQVAMFRFGVDTYGVIDVVVANAGIAEGTRRFLDLKAGEDGEPTEPSLMTLDVNTSGVAYTMKLAFFHLTKNPATEGKSIVVLGSMASFFGLAGAPLYTTSKHAVLGLMRSCSYNAALYGITLNSVHPWFVQTNIFGAAALALLAGIPLATVPDVVAGMIAASAKPGSHGSTFVVDFKGILEVPSNAHQAGEGTFYKAFSDRAYGLLGWAKWAVDMAGAVRTAIKRRSLL
ncbi:hypothetical protein JCM11641_000437 [Rhodosporidiobolus odoratus]